MLSGSFATQEVCNIFVNETLNYTAVGLVELCLLISDGRETFWLENIYIIINLLLLYFMPCPLGGHFFFQIMLELEVVGEDDQVHINAIKDELRRRQPDIPIIMDRMRRTLYKRLEHMGNPTEEVMEMFPFLRVPELVSN